MTADKQPDKLPEYKYEQTKGNNREEMITHSSAMIRERAIAQRLKEGKKYLKGHVVRNGDHTWMEMDGAIDVWFTDLINELEEQK